MDTKIIKVTLIPCIKSVASWMVVETGSLFSNQTCPNVHNLGKVIDTEEFRDLKKKKKID